MSRERRGEPLYRWVIESLRARIENGDYAPGARLPSMVELRAEFGVSDITIRNAMKELAQLGLVETRPRRGIYARSGRAYPPLVGRGVVAAIVEDSSSAFHATILRAIEDGCRESGYHVVIMSTRSQIEVEKRLLHELSKQVAGLLVAPNLRGDYTSYQTLIEGNVPLVFFDQHIPQLAVSSVSTDNVLGGYLAAQHLIEQGRTKVCFIGQPHAISVEERFRGYQQALREAGLAFSEKWAYSVDKMTELESYIVARRLLQEHRGAAPFGVFAINDLFARSCCIAAHEAGLRVPQDVAVVGYDDVMAAFCHPPLSSVRQNLSEMGRQAANLLLDLLQSVPCSETPLQTIRLKPELIVRDSSIENSGFSLARHIENSA